MHEAGEREYPRSGCSSTESKDKSDCENSGAENSALSISLLSLAPAENERGKLLRDGCVNVSQSVKQKKTGRTLGDSQPCRAAQVVR